MKKIGVVVGTRPEIIKMSPVIRELEKNDIKYNIIHTGQHYDEEVSEIFFRELEIERPDKYLDIGSGSQAEQTGGAMIELEKTFKEFGTDILLVQGDTNTVLAGALAGIKMGLEVGHVEAGLRSYDYRMPEEYNRRLTDHASNMLFAPTEENRITLEKEDVWGDIYVTGNTVIDACIQNLKIAEKKAELDFELPHEFILVTAHRAENVDDREVVKNFVEVFEELDHPVVYPIHPRAEKMFKKYDMLDRLKRNDKIYLVPPQGYLEFLILMKRCEFILTDSGGIQEEATAPNIKKKVFVLRRSTERPEAVEAGYCTVVGTKSDDVLDHIQDFDEEKWDPDSCPYGDGRASEKIVDIINKMSE
ncbi:MAG: UDP-N-acetylglucosamine 2-epimerase (non-hydrolyzing) [Candidatus Thermoplasmatota archaeon]|nr:UDP-N-acetylglucosamine 2-epimerase (non-hydrolyzing) [Candidatus Thermoplasmatota archaeon]MBS3789493.1 UDP-N-acetylglucosamine 2-epimerase (non-hydrolyzing) [Candidatus Thermoplasmatota archaeon]